MKFLLTRWNYYRPLGMFLRAKACPFMQGWRSRPGHRFGFPKLIVVVVPMPFHPDSPKATPRGFEPLQAEPNGFLVHHLNHSVTLSMEDVEQVCQDAFSMLGVRSCARARPTWRAPPAQSLPRQCHWPRVLQLAAGKPSFLLLSSKATLETGSYLLYCGLLASLRGTPRSDSEGIRTPAGRAQWISSPSP